MRKNRSRSRGKRRSVKKDNIRQVKRSRRSSRRSRRSTMRSNRRARRSSGRSRRSTMRSNRRARRSVRRSTRRMRGGMQTPLPVRGYESAPGQYEGAKFSGFEKTSYPGDGFRAAVHSQQLRDIARSQARNTARSPSPNRRITRVEKMDMGLLQPDMKYNMNRVYEEITPLIQDSVNRYVTPLVDRAYQDPTSTAILLAVIFGTIQRYMSGKLTDTTDILTNQ
jgi:hypothetical protein